MSKYQPSLFEKSWQEKWKEAGLYRVDLSESTKGKYYLLVELPYPSGDLHMGHWFTFAVTDILGRMKRMQGYNVFFPVGFDAFGLPAENAAIKHGINPREWTYSNIETMKAQFATMGGMHDFEHGVITCDPEYYRWNQWIFLQMFKKGLAYRGKILSNWCPKDQTVLANENVEAGKCWRCGTEVVQKEVDQWMLKITAYAERLLWPETRGPVSSFLPASALLTPQNYSNFGDPVRESQIKTINNKPLFDGNPSTTATRESIDWPQAIRDGQNNWIGKSEGIEIDFPLSPSVILEGAQRPIGSVKGDSIATLQNDKITVFTKFPETIFGVTFMVVAPEHPLALQAAQNMKEVAVYIEQAGKKSELERTALDKSKSGIFTGLYCINQVNGAKIPIWVADYVIGSYGTGAVMGVPGSDRRDFDFAAKYDLPILRVIASKQGDISAIKGEEDILEHGYIVNSGQFDGLCAPNPAKEKFMDYLEKEGFGQRKVNYHLHDWSISRQRYWGTPIPMIHCEACEKNGATYDNSGSTLSSPRHACRQAGKRGSRSQPDAGFPIRSGMTGQDGSNNMPGWFPVPDDQLPVVLPEISNYAPEGKPPLATAEDWVNVKCPNCGGDAKREVDTMDTFVDSSWYFLAYLNGKGESADSRRKGTRKNAEERPWNPEYVKNWMPADLYVGGAEHTLGHTLYSRFFYKFLMDIGAVSFDPTSPEGLRGAGEYAYKRIHHGVILGTDGARMSKSKGNVVNPDEQVAQFGADAVRMYLAFMGPYDLVAPWNPNGLRGVYHFLQRVWELGDSSKFKVQSSKLNSEDLYWMHKTIKKVGDDIAETKYNTAVAALMEWMNYLSRKAHVDKVTKVTKEPKEPNDLKTSGSSGSSVTSVTFTEYKILLLLLAPFAPHMTEELWQKIPQKDSVHLQSWPVYDPGFIAQQTITIVVQVNGKVRDTIEVEVGVGEASIVGLAKESAKVAKFLEGKEVKKTIFVPGKLVNFVV